MTLVTDLDGIAEEQTIVTASVTTRTDVPATSIDQNSVTTNLVDTADSISVPILNDIVLDQTDVTAPEADQTDVPMAVIDQSDVVETTITADAPNVATEDASAEKDETK